MEFQTFEEKFHSIMEKWFTDTSDSMDEFYNKQQQAIDEGIELIFSDLRSSLNSNLNVNKNSSDLEIQSDDEFDFGGLETEIVKHQSKETTPSVDSSSFVIHTSNGEQDVAINGGNQQVEDSISIKEEGSVISAFIHDTGQIEYGGIDGKSDFQEQQWNLVSTDTGQINLQFDKKLDYLGIQAQYDIIDIIMLSDMYCRNRDVKNGRIFQFHSLELKLCSHEMVGSDWNLSTKKVGVLEFSNLLFGEGEYTDVLHATAKSNKYVGNGKIVVLMKEYVENGNVVEDMFDVLEDRGNKVAINFVLLEFDKRFEKAAWELSFVVEGLQFDFGVNLLRLSIAGFLVLIGVELLYPFLVAGEQGSCLEGDLLLLVVLNNDFEEGAADFFLLQLVDGNKSSLPDMKCFNKGFF